MMPDVFTSLSFNSLFCKDNSHWSTARNKKKSETSKLVSICRLWSDVQIYPKKKIRRLRYPNTTCKIITVTRAGAKLSFEMQEAVWMPQKFRCEGSLFDWNEPVIWADCGSAEGDSSQSSITDWQKTGWALGDGGYAACLASACR